MRTGPCPWHNETDAERKRALARATGPCRYCKAPIFTQCVNRATGVTLSRVHSAREWRAVTLFCICKGTRKR